MKPLSLPAVAAAIFVFLLFTSFRSSPYSSASRKQNLSSGDTHYYYYLNGGTTYDGWYSIAEEEARLTTLYGMYVDTNPFGGTLLATGYPIKGIPHTIYATSFLYGH